jgi:phosphopantetheine--protein transferase-like protein
VLALSQSGPVGIDVENHLRGNDLAAIARRFFSAAENSSLTALDDAAWLQQFFAIWTLKEAHGKALGTGLSKILSCSSFVVDSGARLIELQLAAAAASSVPVNCWLYRLADDSSLAVSQLGARPAAITLYRSAPLAATAPPEIYFELTPIATGSWSPNVAPCT